MAYVRATKILIGDGEDNIYQGFQHLNTELTQIYTDLNSVNNTITPVANIALKAHDHSGVTESPAKRVDSALTTAVGGGVVTLDTHTIWHNGNISLTAATDGSCTLPNGLIMKWGYVTPTNGSVAITVSFPANCFTAQATSGNSGADHQNDSNVQIVSMTKDTLTLFTTDNGEGDVPTGVYWFAIGN